MMRSFPRLAARLGPAAPLGRAVSLGLLLLFLAAGCASTGENDGEEPRRRAPRAPDEVVSVDLGLAPIDAAVRTIQLYVEGDERSLPILPLGRGQQLTLEFDLLTDAGRPLSVFFYHADRRWERDLSPIQYLDGFSQDDLLDYNRSRLSTLPYVHYTYRFPNDNIDFLLSGNYIVRVTEQGDEAAVLLEQAFVVTEQAMPVTLVFENALRSGLPFPAVVPVAQFTPPGVDAASAFNYSVCFVRAGRLDLARCADDPSLNVPPSLRFELTRATAFEPGNEDYFLNLINLRAGPRIVDVNLETTPWEVVLEPDYARFPGFPETASLGGRPLVTSVVQDVADPDLSGEYAEVIFQFVPPEERPLAAPVYLAGAFNEWRPDPAYELTWIPENRRYEGAALLKQGQYEYTYISRDRRLRNAFRAAAPPASDVYAALVYFRDVVEGTDRLLTVAAQRL